MFVRNKTIQQEAAYS